MNLLVKVNGKFGRWLAAKLETNDVMVYDLSQDVHISTRAIYNHLKSSTSPRFAHVVTYCWYFNRRFGYKDDPIDIWDNLVEGEY